MTKDEIANAKAEIARAESITTDLAEIEKIKGGIPRIDAQYGLERVSKRVADRAWRLGIQELKLTLEMELDQIEIVKPKAKEPVHRATEIVRGDFSTQVPTDKEITNAMNSR